MLADILPQIEDSLSLKEPITYTPVSGGDINDSYRLQCAGTSYFLKVNSLDKLRMFELEKEGLITLEQAKVFKIPEVYGVGSGNQHSFLLMEWLSEQKPNELQWQLFGKNLSELHSHTQDSFGFTSDNYIGSIYQRNDLRSTWNAFFLECRIEPLVRKAFDSGFIQKKHLRGFEGFSAEVASLFPASKPSLLHGDLWSGNFMYSGEKSMAVFDPSVYYGHPEMELAFTQLFGGFPAVFYEAYEAQSPLEKGFYKRIDLYNLYPNLVHLLLFGHVYLGAVTSVLMKFYR